MSSHTATSARKSQPPEASRHQEESEEEEEEEEAEVPVPTANCVLENTLGSPCLTDPKALLTHCTTIRHQGDYWVVVRSQDSTERSWLKVSRFCYTLL